MLMIMRKLYLWIVCSFLWFPFLHFNLVFRGDFRRLGRNADISTGQDFLKSELPALLQQRRLELKAEREQALRAQPPAEEPLPSPASPDPPYIVPTIKVKPFMYTYQREIVLYCHFRKLNFFSVECTYAASAFRGFAREFLVKLEGWYPQSIMSLIFFECLLSVVIYFSRYSPLCISYFYFRCTTSPENAFL